MGNLKLNEVSRSKSYFLTFIQYYPMANDFQGMWRHNERLLSVRKDGFIYLLPKSKLWTGCSVGMAHTSPTSLTCLLSFYRSVCPVSRYSWLRTKLQTAFCAAPIRFFFVVILTNLMLFIQILQLRLLFHACMKEDRNIYIYTEGKESNLREIELLKVLLWCAVGTLLAVTSCFFLSCTVTG